MTEVPGTTPQSPEQVVGIAVQDLAAARLGRGFLPIVGALAIGVAQLFTQGLGSREAILLVVGAPLSAGAMLAHGLRIVQRAFGRPARPWMVAASLGTVLPPSFGLYLFGWRGLREIAVGGGFGAVALGVLFTALGLWALTTWMKLNELLPLARTMTSLPGTEGADRR